MKSFAILSLLVLFTMTSCEVHEVSLSELQKVTINKMEKSELHLDVTAVLDNPNSFKINVAGSDLDLYLEDRFIGKATLKNNVTLASKTEQAYELEIKAVGEKLNQEMLPIMLTAALSGKVTVRLKGDIKGKILFFSKSVPIDITEEVRFDQQFQ